MGFTGPVFLRLKPAEGEKISEGCGWGRPQTLPTEVRTSHTSSAYRFVKPCRPTDPLIRIGLAGGAAAIFLRLVEKIDLAL